ncbi:MAG: hypothetical protein AAGN82_24890 [Myxococcota bacterium]
MSRLRETLGPAALGGALAALALGAGSGTAAAQESTAVTAVPDVDVRGFDAPTDPAAGLYYEPASAPDTLEVNTALWLAYAHRPLTLRDAAGDRVFDVVRHRLAGNLVGNVGLFGRLAIGIDLPLVLYQVGDDPQADPEATRALGPFDLSQTALGDLDVVAKFTVVPPTSAEFGGFALAVHERFGLPTGDGESFLGEGHVQSTTRVLLEYRYLALGVHAARGARLRAERGRYVCGDFSPDACPTTFGHEIPWGLSLVFQPASVGLDATGRSAWFIEAFGHVPLAPEVPFTNAALSMAQLGLGARTGLPHDLHLITAVDAGLVGGIGNPAVRGHLALSWAPRDHDMDDDGVDDEFDQCPEDLKEDRDGFEDEDGCPDWDNDDDGVPDESDQCADEREDEDGFEDDDGCIDPDNDGDGILDLDDACVDTAGVDSRDPARRGCPDLDPDRDGVEGEADRCPDEPEDLDQHDDGDGCPDPDDDGDGVPDAEDACRAEAGPAGAARGCPDGDGDGVPDREDACREVPGVAVAADPARNGCPTPP